MAQLPMMMTTTDPINDLHF